MIASKANNLSWYDSRNRLSLLIHETLIFNNIEKVTCEPSQCVPWVCSSFALQRFPWMTWTPQLGVPSNVVRLSTQLPPILHLERRLSKQIVKLMFSRKWKFSLVVWMLLTQMILQMMDSHKIISVRIVFLSRDFHVWLALLMFTTEQCLDSWVYHCSPQHEAELLSSEMGFSIDQQNRFCEFGFLFYHFCDRCGCDVFRSDWSESHWTRDNGWQFRRRGWHERGANSHWPYTIENRLSMVIKEEIIHRNVNATSIQIIDMNIFVSAGRAASRSNPSAGLYMADADLSQSPPSQCWSGGETALHRRPSGRLWTLQYSTQRRYSTDNSTYDSQKTVNITQWYCRIDC